MCESPTRLTKELEDGAEEDEYMFNRAGGDQGAAPGTPEELESQGTEDPKPHDGKPFEHGMNVQVFYAMLSTMLLV